MLPGRGSRQWPGERRHGVTLCTSSRRNVFLTRQSHGSRSRSGSLALSSLSMFRVLSQLSSLRHFHLPHHPFSFVSLISYLLFFKSRSCQFSLKEFFSFHQRFDPLVPVVLSLSRSLKVLRTVSLLSCLRLLFLRLLVLLQLSFSYCNAVAKMVLHVACELHSLKCKHKGCIGGGGLRSPAG